MGKYKNKKKDYGQDSPKENKSSNEAFIAAMNNFTLPKYHKHIMAAYFNMARRNLYLSVANVFVNAGGLFPFKEDDMVKPLMMLHDKISKQKIYDDIEKTAEYEKQMNFKRIDLQKLHSKLYHSLPMLAPATDDIKKMQLKSVLSDNSASLVSTLEDCLKALINYTLVITDCRNRFTHYRAYMSPENQEYAYHNQKEVSYLLDSVMMAGRRICKRLDNLSQTDMDFIEQSIHYEQVEIIDEETKKPKKDKQGRLVKIQSERKNFYFRIKGTRNVIDAKGKVIEGKSCDALSDFGLVFLVCLFISKTDSEVLMKEVQLMEKSPFKNRENELVKQFMSVYRIHLPRGKRLDINDDAMQLGMDMLNELRKCPKELFNLLDKNGKKCFEDDVTALTGEIDPVSHNPISRPTGEKAVRKRNGDRFPYLALRYVDKKNLLDDIRFQLHLGSYRYSFYKKTTIDGEEKLRILQKGINGYGKLVEIEGERLIQWKESFQKVDIKDPNATDKSEIAIDEDGNIIQLVQPVESVVNNDPYITDHRANYNFTENRIGLYWQEDGITDVTTKYLPPLSCQRNPQNSKDDDCHKRALVSQPAPLVFLSIRELPALLFYHYLWNTHRDGNDSPAMIIKANFRKMRQMFHGIADGTIKSKSDVENLGIKWVDVPQKLRDYLIDKNVNVSARLIDAFYGKNKKNGHLQERIEWFERKKRKFKDLQKRIKSGDNKRGKKKFDTIRPNEIARNLATWIMDWIPKNSKCAAKMTTPNFEALVDVLANYGTRLGCDESRLSIVLTNGFVMECHPFITDVIKTHPKGLEDLYLTYITQEISHLKSKLQQSHNRKTLETIPFAHIDRLRWANRDDNYYKALAKRYLNIDDKNRAVLFLPDGLFTEHILRILQKTDDAKFSSIDAFKVKENNAKEENEQHNVSHLIATYLEEVLGDKSQSFYYDLGRSYDFFKEWKHDKKDVRNPKSALKNQYLTPRQIADALRGRTELKKKIKHRVTELYESKEIQSQLQREEENLLKKLGKERNPKKREEMNQKLKALKSWKEIMNDKLLRMAHECAKGERTIRRYRIQDILIFLMAKDLLGNNFKEKTQQVPFLLQNVTSSAFLSQTVEFSYKLKSSYKYKKDDKTYTITMPIEIRQDNLAIKNYNLAFRYIKDDRLESFLSQVVHVLAEQTDNEKLKESEGTIVIDYNKLSGEFDSYNKLRSQIFDEIHLIESLIVDPNKEIYNNPLHKDFYVHDSMRAKNGEEKSDENAVRNSFSSLLKTVYKILPDEEIKAIQQEIERTEALRVSLIYKVMVAIRNAFSHNHFEINLLQIAAPKTLRAIIASLSPQKEGDTPKAAEEKDVKTEHIAKLIVTKLQSLRKTIDQDIKKKRKS